MWTEHVVDFHVRGGAQI